MAKIPVKERKVVELHPHPKNQDIYGDEDIKELAELIDKYGLRKPLIVTPQGTIISGHRRWRAVLFLGWEKVCVEEKEFLDDTAELEALLLENANREKSIEQKCREGLMWEAIERANSRKRQGIKGLGVGSTRDVVAKRVGLGSGINYENARKVVSAIDEALLIGDIVKAAALRKTLNHKSVNAAFKMISSIENISETQHTQMQWILAKLGQKLCGSVWIASNDRSRIWEKEELGNFSIDSLPPLGIRNDAQKTVALIDVLWLSGDNQIAAAFEIECTTSIYSGLLRMADLVALVPNLNFPLYVVVPQSRVVKVKKELSRPSFQTLKMNNKCNWIVLEDLAREWEAIMKYGTELDAINRLSDSLNKINANFKKECDK